MENSWGELNIMLQLASNRALQPPLDFISIIIMDPFVPCHIWMWYLPEDRNSWKSHSGEIRFALGVTGSWVVGCLEERQKYVEVFVSV